MSLPHTASLRSLLHLVVTGCLVAGVGGCLVKDGGASQTRDGAPLPGAVCDASAPAGSDGCPACSTSEGGLCRDRWYAAAVRCQSDAQCTAAGGTCGGGYCVMKDSDGDGIDDDLEQEVAERNFPALYADPDEKCGDPSGIVYRLHHHPDSPRRVVITYVVLYTVDCGPLNGHLGDNESFSITVDLDSRPGGTATVAAKTWAHANTVCESVSSCTTEPGAAGCALTPPGESEPVVAIFASRDKHSHYLFAGTCERNCADHCAAGKRITPSTTRLINAGEPEHAMVHDLSVGEGFVTVARGWDARLLHHDPWSTGAFGGAGHIAKQLTTFLAATGD